MSTKPAVQEKVSARQGIGYFFGEFAVAFALMMVPNYISIYYSDVVGIAVGTIGTIILVMKITDGVSDILVGYLIDRTNTRFGKARPWLLAGAVGTGISLALLFSCPADFSMAGKIAFCAATYFLVNPFFLTIVSVAESVLVNYMVKTDRARTVLGLCLTYSLGVATMVVTFLVPPALVKLGEDSAAYQIIAVVFALITIVSGIIGFLLMKETVTEEREQEEDIERLSAFESLKYLFKNKYFVLLALGTIFYNVSLVSGGPTYYAKYILGNLSYAGLLAAPMLLCIVLVPIGAKLMQKTGKRMLFVLGYILNLISCTGFFFANDNLVLCLLASAGRWIGYVPMFCAIVPLTGQVADYSYQKEGKHIDGMIFSGYSMGGKVGTGLGAAIVGWVLAFGGYNGAEALTASAVMSIRLANSLIPFLFNLLALICFALLKVEDEVKE